MGIIMLMKKCNVCSIEKNEYEFYKHPNSKDGLANRCKACVKECGNITRMKWLEDCKNKEKHRFRGSLKKRPYLKYRDSKCRRCGFIPENNCQLTVDHIDKNRKNNNVDNLQTLCHNCHNLKSWIETVEPEKLKNMNLIP